jgi:hypothetical protein
MLDIVDDNLQVMLGAKPSCSPPGACVVTLQAILETEAREFSHGE